MPIVSGDFLVSSKSCIELGSEVDFRNAVSRAYYAMYHEANNSLKSQPNYSGSQHSGLIGYLTNKSQNKLEPYDPYQMKLLGYRLDQQRKARHEADYDLESVEISKLIAEVAIGTAEEFFESWKSLKTAKAV